MMSKLKLNCALIFTLLCLLGCESKELKDTRILAENGNMEAQDHLGYIYLNGLAGSKIDVETAKGWFEKAALQGDILRIEMFADSYTNGNSSLNIPQNKELAFKWNKMLSNAGRTKGDLAVAYSYVTGAGVSPDLDEAIVY